MQVALCRGISPAKGDSANLWSCRELYSQNEVPQPGWQCKDSILDSFHISDPPKRREDENVDQGGKHKNKAPSQTSLLTKTLCMTVTNEHASGLK